MLGLVEFDLELAGPFTHCNFCRFLYMGFSDLIDHSE
jgi:hypothetical protein